MVFKLIVVLMLLIILASLGQALFSLIREKGDSDRTIKALTVRIGLSVGLFLLLMFGYATGLITPHSL